MFYLVGCRVYEDDCIKYLILDTDTLFITEVTREEIASGRITLENVTPVEVSDYFSHKGISIITGTDTIVVESNGRSRILYSNIMDLTGKTVINNEVPFYYVPYISKRCGLFTEMMLEFDLLLNGHYFYVSVDSSYGDSGCFIKINDIEFRLGFKVPFALGYDVKNEQFLIILEGSTGDSGWIKLLSNGSVELDYEENKERIACTYGADEKLDEAEFQRNVSINKRRYLFS